MHHDSTMDLVRSPRLVTHLSMIASKSAVHLPLSRTHHHRTSYPTLNLLPSFPREVFACVLSGKRAATPKVSPVTNMETEEENEDEECELVNGAEVSIGEGSDKINAYLLKAVKNNNGAGILLLSDIYGYEDSSTRDFAYRVACNGYNVLVPDLFSGNPWGKQQPETKFEAWISDQDSFTNDVASLGKNISDLLGGKEGVTKKLGIIGICFGGGKALELLSQDIGAVFGVGVLFYGIKMDPSLASKVKTPVLFVGGDNDPNCPVSLLHEMERNIEGSRVVVYKGRGHDFVHRPASPDEDEDAEKAFAIMRNWLHDALISQKS